MCDRVVRHAGADGVQVDVAAAAQKTVFAIDQAGLVPTFPERSGARVARVELPDIAPAELLHQATCGTHCGRRCQQVDVVVHQYIGVQLAARGEQRLPQQLAIAGAIRVVEEAGKAIVSTLHDVLRNAWQVESRLASHVHSIAAAVATMRGHNAGDAVGIRRAGLSEVNLTLFPGPRFPGWPSLPAAAPRCYFDSLDPGLRYTPRTSKPPDSTRIP